MELLQAFLERVLDLAQLLLILLFGRRAFWTWRILDQASRARPHASEQQQIQMAQLAGRLNLDELDTLAQRVLREASERLARQH